jgi:hypothetical protein
MRKRKTPAAPPNIAAMALHGRLFGPRIVKSGKAYSRRIKHKKGEFDGNQAPLFLCAFRQSVAKHI